MIPPVTQLDQRDTVRLIPSKYSTDDASVLNRIADDNDHLQDIFALDALVNDRLRAQADLLTGLSAEELVTDVPFASIINAAYCHASPEGARFNGPDRGAWYAGFQPETSLAEVSFHHTLWLQETNHLHDTVTYDAYLADFAGAFHDVRQDEIFANCIGANDYTFAQLLGATLLENDATGIVYPSARATGDCLAAFAQTP